MIENKNRAFVSSIDISFAGASSRLADKGKSDGQVGQHKRGFFGCWGVWGTHSRMMIFPNPYQRPPAPTNADSLTLLASALSAFRTRELNGGGMVKSA